MRSREHFCRGKAVNITYSETVYVVLVIQHAMRMLHIILPPVPCLGLPYFSTLSHIRHDFKKNDIRHKMCALIFSTTFIRNISHSRKNSARYYRTCTLVFTQSTRYSCQIWMKVEFSLQILEKYSDIEDHENPSSRSPVIPCGQTHAQIDGRTDTYIDMTKIRVLFGNSSNASKKP